MDKFSLLYTKMNGYLKDYVDMGKKTGTHGMSSHKLIPIHLKGLGLPVEFILELVPREPSHSDFVLIRHKYFNADI